MYLMYYKLILLLVISAVSVHAHAKSQKILSHAQAGKIVADARGVVSALAEHLSYIVQPDQEEADVDAAIADKFSGPGRLFYNDQVEITLNPANARANTGPEKSKMLLYLKSFRNRFIPQAGDENSVKFEITANSDIFEGENSLFIYVYYNERFNGKYKDSILEPHKTPWLAELRIVEIGNGYRSYISSLEPQVGQDISSFKRVVISDEGNGSTVSGLEAAVSEGYYVAMLKKGQDALKRDLYGDAFYALSEARRGTAQASAAESSIRQINLTMTARGLDYFKDLSEQLIAKASRFEEAYQYNEAARCFNYAKEVRPDAAVKLEGRLQALGQRQEREHRLAALLDKEAYSEAISSYKTVISKEPENPYLLLGLARAYAGAGMEKDALTAFMQAKAKSPGTAEAYRQLASFYETQQSYGKAYDELVTYQSLTPPDAGDKKLLSRMAYDRGMQLFQEGKNGEAADSFKSALANDPANKGALVARASQYLYRRDFGNAEKAAAEALRGDNTYAPALYVKAQALEGAENLEDAIAAYQSAIAADPANFEYRNKLGCLQTTTHNYRDAENTFSICIGLSPRRRREIFQRQQAYWLRGKVYYLQNKNNEAIADYKTYEDSAQNIGDAFYLDYANLHIQKGTFSEAIAYLDKIKQKNVLSGMWLSRGIVYYLQANSGYSMLFERAFENIDKDIVRYAPRALEVYDHCSEFRKLCKNKKIRFD